MMLPPPIVSTTLHMYSQLALALALLLLLLLLQSAAARPHGFSPVP
jgi:hypothetical protein